MPGIDQLNYLLFPVLVITFVLFIGGVLLARQIPKNLFFGLCVLGGVIAIPGVLFAAYYLKLLHHSMWFFEFRSIPFTELSAAGAGFLAGLLHGKLSTKAKFRRIAGSWFFPGILALGILLPHIKPIIRPVRWADFQDRWSGNICLQTSESSCGPACAATLLRRLGKPATEVEIAKESFTSRNGTEVWYLARMFRKQGMEVQFVFQSDTNQSWPYPAIAGVRLPQSGNTGHFITILDHSGDKYVIGDPLDGEVIQSRSELRDTYDFTGFFMVIK